LKKYICSICGFVYEEAIGDPKNGIAAGTKWEDIPEEWCCPLCGAVKDSFEEEFKTEAISLSEKNDEEEKLRELSFDEVSVLFSNLSKGCSKQYRFEEADLFNQLSEFYKSKRSIPSEAQLNDISNLIKQNLDSSYGQANLVAGEMPDRGALRALVWGEKVTKILKSILDRYEKQKDALIENTRIYVCDICGFVYIGDALPEICPVCKVTNKKITEIRRG
jgi:rubredoxin